MTDGSEADGDSSDAGMDSSVTSDARRRRAASIYGTIVTAAVIAAGGSQLTSAQLAVTIVVTLIVYWLAEQYAELLGTHTHDGHLPSLGLVRSSLAEAWPMVTASFVPVASIGVASPFRGVIVGRGPCSPHRDRRALGRARLQRRANRWLAGMAAPAGDRHCRAARCRNDHPQVSAPASPLLGRPAGQRSGRSPFRCRRRPPILRAEFPLAMRYACAEPPVIDRQRA